LDHRSDRSLSTTIINKKIGFTDMNYEVILAKHKESINWLKFVPKKKNRNYSIYLSNSDEESFSPFVDKEVIIENIGREAGHYLQYIINNYNNLPPVCIFMQANPWQHFSEPEHCLNIFYGNPNFKHPFCYIGEDYNQIGLPIEKFSLKERILKEGWKDEKIPRSTRMAVGGQFYVKKEIILKRNKDHYQSILNTANWDGISLAHILEPHWGSVFNHEK
jgi:hypothetical protein